MDKDFVIDV